MYLNIRCILTFIIFSLVLSKKHYLIETADHDKTSTGEDHFIRRSVGDKYLFVEKYKQLPFNPK